VGALPVAARIALLALVKSAIILVLDIWDKLAWPHEWLPTAWPSAAARETI